MYICSTHYCFLKFFADIRENLFQCMEMNWRKASHITDYALEGELLYQTSLNFEIKVV